MRIITVCGSMRYYNQMLALANELTREGAIVLLPFVLKVDDPGLDEQLQELHRAKIDLSDEVYAFAGEQSTAGTSTLEELEYAREKGKRIFVYAGFPAIGEQSAWNELNWRPWAR